ncbi:hypothetical protein D9M71_169830 [compost metagenome]
MRRIFGQANAREVDVHATVSLVRPEQLDRQVRVFLVQATVVVGVDDTDVALTGVDSLQQGGVIGEHVGGQVVDPALDDFLGFLLAVGFDQGSGQRLVVDLLRRAQAQAPFPVLVGQGFVGAQLFGFDPLGGVGDGPRAQAQAGPVVGRGAVLLGNVGIDDFRFDRLQDAHLLGLPEVTGIDSEQQVGGGVLPLGLDPLHQRCFLVGDELDLDPGLGGIGVEHRLDQLVDARGIHHHLVRRLGGTAQQGQSQGGQYVLAWQHGAVLGVQIEAQMVVNPICLLNRTHRGGVTRCYGWTRTAFRPSPVLANHH